MLLGVIYGVRDSIKWIPKDKDKGAILSSFVKGIKLLDWCDSKIESYYCNEAYKNSVKSSNAKKSDDYGRPVN